MRIAFVTTYDPLDPRSWSGIPASVIRGMKAAGAEVVPITVRGSVSARLVAGSRSVLARARRHGYRHDRDPVWLRSLAAEVEIAIGKIRPDVVFSPGTVPIAYLECDAPIVFWTDATFANVIDFYPEFSGLGASSLKAGHAMERSALARSAAAFYSSRWAARTAVAYYGASAERVHVARFGPNVPGIPGRAETERVVAERSWDVCKVIFVASDWRRKGGEVVLEVGRRVAAAGVPLDLVLVGDMPKATPLPPCARHAGWIDKSDPVAVERFCQELQSAHFFLFPTSADTTPVALAEAAAHGVPALAPDLGGIAEVVRDGVSGVLVRRHDDPAEYARLIIEIWADRRRHTDLALGAFDDHLHRLNWQVSVRLVLDHLERVVMSA
jgi:glycosyltransferase involved in cell wall biosynthesis